MSIPISTNIDKRQFIFDLLYDPIKNIWVQWVESQEEMRISHSIPYHKLLIPTNDSIRNDYFLNFSVRHKIHLLLSGPTGTGKTVNVINQLNTNYYNVKYTNLQTVFSG
jgi:dynein heavy chain